MSKRRPTVTLVDNRYQPSKAELDEPIVFPKGTTPKKLARAVLRNVKVKNTPKPKVSSDPDLSLNGAGHEV